MFEITDDVMPPARRVPLTPSWRRKVLTSSGPMQGGGFMVQGHRERWQVDGAQVGVTGVGTGELVVAPPCEVDHGWLNVLKRAPD